MIILQSEQKIDEKIRYNTLEFLKICTAIGTILKNQNLKSKIQLQLQLPLKSMCCICTVQ